MIRGKYLDPEGFAVGGREGFFLLMLLRVLLQESFAFRRASFWTLVGSSTFQYWEGVRVCPSVTFYRRFKKNDLA